MVRRFRQVFGSFPWLWTPRSFNEKILSKKLFDRHPLRPRVADKYAVRCYVHERLGPKEAEDILVPVHQVVDRVEDLSFSSLPDAYVVKATHGSGWNVIVRENETPDPGRIREQCRRWLASTYGQDRLEWVYARIEPRLLVEQMLVTDEGEIPADVKFFVMNGSVELIQVDTDRFQGHERTLYRPDWTPLDVELEHPRGPVTEPPENLDRMRHLAKQLADPFDFIRVDLYEVESSVFFGELTSFPGSGFERFDPPSFDLELGERWEIVNSPEEGTDGGPGPPLR